MPVKTNRSLAFVLFLAYLAACASAPSTRTSYVDPDYGGSGFENFLVIGVAGSYNSRAQFEREVVSGIRSAGADATAYYNLAGNAPISRDAVLDAVRQNQFDAVVVTRVKGQEGEIDVEEGATGTKATTIGGRPINFFRYDYEDLNEPDSLSFTMSVVLTTELFAADDERMIQSFDTTSSGAENIGILIDGTAQAIVRRLANDDRIGR